MDVSDLNLRVMVRDAIARHGRPETPSMPSADGPPLHASHGRLGLAAGGDADGRCLIEPAVRCTDCGYCVSLGH